MILNWQEIVKATSKNILTPLWNAGIVALEQSINALITNIANCLWPKGSICLLCFNIRWAFRNVYMYQKNHNPKINVWKHKFQIEELIWYTVDVLLGQSIKLIQVVSTSKFHEYWWIHFGFIFFVPSTCCRASEASKIDYFKN